MLLAALAILTACAGHAPPPVSTTPAPPSAPQPANAAALPLTLASYDALPGWSTTDAARALSAFRTACPALLHRADTSGLTQPGDWTDACTAAHIAATAIATTDSAARAVIEAQLVPVRIGDGTGLVTAYFELSLNGSRTRDSINTVPLYARPPDLIDVDLGQFAPTLAGKHIRGRVDHQHIVPYPDRAQIEDGALPPGTPVVAWVADPVEAFFLAVQGSGRVALADGTELRVGYAGQNGRDYTGIGRLLRERGLLSPGHATMEGIVAWAHAHPDEGRALMRENKSYIFFKPLTGPGPLGALGVPLTPEVSVAADPAFVSLGAPIYLVTQTVDGALARVVVAADTGGAIKGPNRFDWFTGAGPRARRLASSQTARGRAWLLLPKAAAERLHAPPR